MSEFDEVAFQVFLSENTLQYETQKKIATVALRAQCFLAERGVQFPPADRSEDDWFIDDAQLDDYVFIRRDTRKAELGRELTEEEHDEILDDYRQKLTQLYADRQVLINNGRRLNSLAKAIAQHEILRANGEEPSIEESTRRKKRLQARYKVEGASSAWQELVDAKLPGESLSEGDKHIVDEVTLQYIEVYMAAEERLEKIRKAIKGILVGEGVHELSHEEEVAVVLLANNRAVFQGGWASWQEEANLILLNRGLPVSSAWEKVIAHLMPRYSDDS